ncbi:MAG: hypothetical protein HY682_01705 [Chloroflexi bacterium]|nr:hypothetical protein [Chloroflexota bacterium]
MPGWLAGLLGGLIATAAMTVVMMPTMKGPSGPSILFSKITKGDPNSSGLKMAGMMGHFAYGATAGLVFGAITIDGFGWAQSIWGWGALYGLALLGIMMMLWVPMLGMIKQMMAGSMGQRMTTMMAGLGAHVVYGLVLGVLVGAWAV